MKQSGANSVITSSDAVGRLLGLSSLSPTLGSVMEDLLTYGEGLEVAERDLLVTEVGKQPQSLPDQVIAVVRDEKVYRYFDPVVTQLARGDRLIVVRPAKELPWAPAPGTHDEELRVRGRFVTPSYSSRSSRVHESNFGVYGAPQGVAPAPTARASTVARCTVERLMSQAGLAGAVRGASTRTTRPDPAAPRPEDLVERQFVASRPNELWVVDFTYVATWSGFVYVAFCVDVFARVVTGWRVSRSMKTDLVLDALEMGIWQRHRQGHDIQGLVHHSDAGSLWLRRLYASPDSVGWWRWTSSRSASESLPQAGAVQLAKLLIFRDRVCRTPWCGAPIRHLDHAVDHDRGGPKPRRRNGQGLCETCNHAKQAPSWRAGPAPGQSADDPTIVTTTPTGHRYLSRPPQAPTPYDGRSKRPRVPQCAGIFASERGLRSVSRDRPRPDARSGFRQRRPDICQHSQACGM
jgi:hypothetical protein